MSEPQTPNSNKSSVAAAFLAVLGAAFVAPSVKVIVDPEVAGKSFD
jgi:hypothetical protein